MGWNFILTMTKIPPDDILEGLYKLRLRESEKLKTALELYNMVTHQQKAGPDYHRSGNYETSAVVKNQGTKQREQKSRRLLAMGSQRAVL